MMLESSPAVTTNGSFVNTSSSLSPPLVQSQQQQQQQFINSQVNPQASMMLQMMTPSTFAANLVPLVQSDQFPDILQYTTNEQTKSLLDTLQQLNSPSLTNKQGASRGYTALHWICVRNDIDFIEQIVTKCKADVNVAAGMGETALFVSIKNCNLNAIELILEHGADLSHRDMYNRSFLHWAAYTGKVVIMYYFQKYHSIGNLNDVDQFLQNPLHIACASGFSDLIIYLMKKSDIDIFAQDFNGNTVLHMAAKCGLSRICWMLAQMNKGEGVRLVGIPNKQMQLPFDIIKNERGYNYKMIRDWLRLEAKTNEWLISSTATATNSQEEYLLPSSSRSVLKIKKGTRCLSWNSKRKMQVELFVRSTSFFMALTIPVLVNLYLMPVEVHLGKGLVGFGLTIILMLMQMMRQRHRINHISGEANPFYTSFFAAVFLHNYAAFYTMVFETFYILNVAHWACILLTIWHGYTFYKIMTADPGFCGPRENFKKPDGSSYELRDLMRLHRQKQSEKQYLSNNHSHKHEDLDPTASLYFCETCLIVQASPAKHCKLCEHCCLKFDHHCLYIIKCVGLRNHRHFMNFLFASITCIVVFVYYVVFYLFRLDDEIAGANQFRTSTEQYGLMYFICASTPHIWLTILVAINLFAISGIVLLTLVQLRVIMLGFTTHFMPPNDFLMLSKRTKTVSMAISHYMSNLYTFFFKSYAENEELYFNQMKEYREAKIIVEGVRFGSEMGANKSAVNNSSTSHRGLYPRDHHDNFNYVNSNNVPSLANPASAPPAQKKESNEPKHYEIELD